MAEEEGGGAAPARPVTVVASLGPRSTREWVLDLPAGATVRDALTACGLAREDDGGQNGAEARPALGIWGRPATLDTPLRPQDRVELYRPLTVDPKVARRERFARQGARGTGLFARRRPGGKAGY